MLTQTSQKQLRYNILDEGESIFCFGRSWDAERILLGKRHPEKMEYDDRWAHIGYGSRLIAAGDGDGQAPIPDIAYEGFMWCGHAEVFSAESIENYEIPGVHRNQEERYLFELIPKTMDHVYVADHAAFLTTRDAMWENRPSPYNPISVTKAEMRPAYSARARTIVPITEYDGSYEMPIILVKCDVLSYDEIQLVSGPWATLDRGELRYW